MNDEQMDDENMDDDNNKLKFKEEEEVFKDETRLEYKLEDPFDVKLAAKEEGSEIKVCLLCIVIHVYFSRITKKIF